MPEVMEVPWIPQAALLFLGTIVQPALKVFEYGSGGSTIYFARKSCALVTVEHDRDWFEAVRAKLQSHSISGVDLRLVLPEEQNIGTDNSDPAHYYEPPCTGNYRQYVSAIDGFDQAAFDIILVDGTARPSCLQHAHLKVKPGGYLILDNSERLYYLAQVEHLFKRWERYVFWGHGPINPYMWECTVWKRP